MYDAGCTHTSCGTLQELRPDTASLELLWRLYGCAAISRPCKVRNVVAVLVCSKLWPLQVHDLMRAACCAAAG